MDEPNIPQKGPYKVKVEKDKTYFWCACGLSQNNLFVMDLIGKRENLSH